MLANTKQAEAWNRAGACAHHAPCTMHLGAGMHPYPTAMCMHPYPTAICIPPLVHLLYMLQCLDYCQTARQPQPVACCNKRDAPQPNGQAHMTRLCRLLPADEPGVFRTGTSPCRLGSARCVSQVTQLPLCTRPKGEFTGSTPGRHAFLHQPLKCRRAPCQTSSAASPSQRQRHESQFPSQAGTPLPSSPAAQLECRNKSKTLTLRSLFTIWVCTKQMWPLDQAARVWVPGSSNRQKSMPA